MKPPHEWETETMVESILAVIERTVNWEAERPYGVEGQGPFDEF